MSRSLGSSNMARPTSSIFCSPPESVPACWFAFWARTGNCSNAIDSIRSRVSFRSRRLTPPSSRFDRTDIDGKMLRPCGTKLIPRRSSSIWLSPTMSSPSNQTWPDLTLTMPKTALSAVDLPAPFGPMMVVMAFRCTSKVVSWRIVVEP